MVWSEYPHRGARRPAAVTAHISLAAWRQIDQHIWYRYQPTCPPEIYAHILEVAAAGVLIAAILLFRETAGPA